MVIRVSRHGMTRCTSCDRHIRLEAVVSETRCPFCGGALTAPTTGRGLLGRTGGALAASLMSFGIGAGCLDDTERNSGDAADVSDSSVTDTADAADGTDSSDTRPDTTPDPDSIQPVYGLPMDVEIADDSTPQPEYGLPMDTSDDDTEDVKDTSGTDDIPIAPLYGLPPADTVEPADDATPQPEYGLPMDVVDDTGPDAGDTKDDAKETESDGSLPVPLYGLPPG
jgi:predicted RNA-binding Zn-ribbon protein involved in translation (DUF1610 family)